MIKSRLLKLADKLDTVKPEKFNLLRWECGTTACAVGYACSMPEFRKLGLAIKKGIGEEYYPLYKEKESWDAVQKFFELTTREAFYLFAYDNYRDFTVIEKVPPSEVAARIRAFVKAGGIPSESLASSRREVVEL